MRTILDDRLDIQSDSATKSAGGPFRLRGLCEGAVADHPGAEQGCGVRGGVRGRDGKRVPLVGDRILGVAEAPTRRVKTDVTGLSSA